MSIYFTWFPNWLV